MIVNDVPGAAEEKIFSVRSFTSHSVAEELTGGEFSFLLSMTVRIKTDIKIGILKAIGCGHVDRVTFIEAINGSYSLSPVLTKSPRFCGDSK
jgi:hypothetical protein